MASESEDLEELPMENAVIQRPVEVENARSAEVVYSVPKFAIFRSIKVRLDCLEAGFELIESSEGALEDLNELKAIQEAMDAAVKDIGELSEEEFSSLKDIRVSFACKYRDLREKLNAVVSSRKCKSESTSSANVSDFPPVKLPALDIPKFNGEIEKWSAFRDIFWNIVNDDRIPYNDAARKQYLYQEVTGDTRCIIENLQDSNFETCSQLLVQTYDDPFRRAQAHYHAIFNTTKATINQSLRQRIVAYRQHSEGLRAAYKELGLDGFEQIIITNFLDAPSTKPSLRLAWERRVTDKQKSSLKDFFAFIDQESQSTDRAFKKVQAPPRRSQVSAVVRKNPVIVCEQCKDTHYLNQCPEFRNLTVSSRMEFVKGRKLCLVCFRANCNGVKKFAAAYLVKNIFCKKCGKPHNTLLHVNGESNLSSLPVESCPSKNLLNVSQKSSHNNEQLTVCLFNENVTHDFEPTINYEPLLATTIIRVHRPNINTSSLEARAFLDNGSQLNFITKALANRLGLISLNTHISISGIGSKLTSVRQMTELKISSRHTNFSIKIQCLLVENIITSMILNHYFNVGSWNLSPRLRLADPYFNVPAEIDLLLGLDVFWQVLEKRTLKIGLGLPRLHETKFGWIIAGSIGTAKSAHGTSIYFIQLSNDELLNQMKKFWVIENYENLPLTKEDVECERIFVKTIYRQDDGRFVVSLPFKQDPAIIGESRSQALKQFYHLEWRLQHNLEMKINYINCMNEYINLGHMRKINENSNFPNFYLPHHAVVNPTSTTTKQRTVFNASAKTTSGLSLNDILYTGPVVQPELIAILIRFRLPSYVMSADIVKMYRQIRIHPEHAIFQRVFWRDSPSKPLETYELDTLSFGERPAPYLATRCLNELALKYGDAYPNAKPVILNDFYVDNLLTGSNSLDQAISIQEQLITLLNSAGFPLSKWCSNAPKLLSKIEPKNIETKISFTFGQAEMIKTLGMYWIPTDDSFKLWFNRSDVAESHTKRQVLSIIASIFDPMGLIGPITVTAKCFMQEIWKSSAEPIENSSTTTADTLNSTNTISKQKTTQKRIHWDDAVPNKILIPWKNFAKNLQDLNRISLPRHIMSSNAKNLVFELHGFAPTARVSPGRNFAHTGIDFAGPFSIIGKGGRHKVEIKAIAVLVCFVTKAIHLELVSDLTTPTFIASLTRFTGRRGTPAHIYSDNGTTFVGANNSLTELTEFLTTNWPKLEEFASIKGFQWHFIPPRAPYFGGIWEAGVKSVKKHLYKVIGNRVLNFEQYTTILVEIEACLNSRPLISESANPNDDLEALTPGHFLTGAPITALPQPNYSDIPDNRLKHWEAVRKMTQLFWKRWTTEYLNTLQQRYKWRFTKGEVKLNDLVLIKETDLPPTQWKKGRIVELHPGKDGQIRVVTLRTSTGLVKRPITNLIFLPKNDA